MTLEFYTHLNQLQSIKQPQWHPVGAPAAVQEKASEAAGIPRSVRTWRADTEKARRWAWENACLAANIVWEMECGGDEVRWESELLRRR